MAKVKAWRQGSPVEALRGRVAYAAMIEPSLAPKLRAALERALRGEG